MLEEYVRNGGSLVLFTQQHGFDWELLPTPVNPDTGERKPVTGYGYQEDQSCEFNSVYIDTYHPILSSFQPLLPTLGWMDILLHTQKKQRFYCSRIANGQPAMIFIHMVRGRSSLLHFIQTLPSVTTKQIRRRSTLCRTSSPGPRSRRAGANQAWRNSVSVSNIEESYRCWCSLSQIYFHGFG